MRLFLAAAVLLCGATVQAQTNLWSHVSVEFNPPQLNSTAVTGSQSKAIANLLRAKNQFGEWECDGDEMDEMLRGLTFQAIQLSPGKDVFLVQAGAGCARGGQGSNGAMWLIRFAAGKPVLLASPKEGFSGWLYSVQSSASHGYRDIVLGWHMSAAETSLSYFRFDGKAYRDIGNATLLNEDDNPKILPRSR